MRTFIERHPAGRRDVIDNLERWKQMRRDGWQLTVLYCYRERRSEDSVLAFGYLPERAARQA